LIRKIYAATSALEPELREMILALYVHSNTFLEADDVRDGSVYFSCQASQRQLADFCNLADDKGAYRRLVRLQKLELVDWTPNRSHKANEYHVQLSILSSGSKRPGEPAVDELFPGPSGLPAGVSSSGVQEHSSGVEDFSSGFSGASSGVQQPDSAFSAVFELPFLPVVVKQETSFAETRETLDPTAQHQAQPQAQHQEPHPVSAGTNGSALPKIPVHSAAQPMEENPPATRHHHWPGEGRTEDTPCKWCGSPYRDRYDREPCVPKKEGANA
jgi:hypothetical protein